MGARRHHLRLLAVGALLAVGVGTAACATGSTSFDNPATSHHIVVVAAEGQADRYVVIDGYKRLVALEQLGRDTVEAVVWPMG